mmetsp:Transcript_27919/g.66260  ORF Transcript_27919/g.66260 Transcript_27919/m.66260 type:complete len:211 (-) Transcript_27919:487-1119(-)
MPREDRQDLILPLALCCLGRLSGEPHTRRGGLVLEELRGGHGLALDRIHAGVHLVQGALAELTDLLALGVGLEPRRAPGRRARGGANRGAHRKACGAANGGAHGDGQPEGEECRDHPQGGPGHAAGGEAGGTPGGTQCGGSPHSPRSGGLDVLVLNNLLSLQLSLGHLGLGILHRLRGLRLARSVACLHLLGGILNLGVHLGSHGERQTL